MDASRRGFLGDVEQAELDFISTSEFQFAYMLYSPNHRASILPCSVIPSNDYEHPEAKERSPAWKSLAQIHSYDVVLFKFIRQEYGNQAQLYAETSAFS
jgi:hypothetical protein